MTEIIDPEPIFTIRAQDALAVPAIRAYALLCAEHGLYDQSERVYSRTLGQFRAWQRKNIKHTHLPDYGGQMKETI